MQIIDKWTNWIMQLIEFFTETVLVPLSMETWFASSGTCEEDCFCGWSGKTIKPDGTSAARSGGWSFPTLGLACKEIRQAHNDHQWINNRWIFYFILKEKRKRKRGALNLLTSKSTYERFLPIDLRN